MILGRSILSVNFFFFFLRAREIISTKFSFFSDFWLIFYICIYINRFVIRFDQVSSHEWEDRSLSFLILIFNFSVYVFRDR